MKRRLVIALGLCLVLVGTILVGAEKQQPIARFQALQHRMADMFVQATQARSMSILAAGRCAAQGDADLRRRDVSAAKCYVGKAARFVGQQAVQLHGGMGMADELAVSHYFKRLTLIDMTFGDSSHHLAAVSDAIPAQRAASPPAMSATVAPTSIAMADVGPIASCRDVPNTA